MKHLISIFDLSKDEILELFELAGKVKASAPQYQGALKGKTLGLIFEKPSTRTWVSFESGIYSLGGNSIYLGPHDIALGVREEVRDVARVLARYLDGVILRTHKQSTIIEFGKHFKRPVINGLSDTAHPCQSLSDFFTIREKLPGKKDPLICFVGDGNNVLNSHLLMAAKLGARINYATPKKHEPVRAVLREAGEIAGQTGAKIEGFSDPQKAVRDADVVYTDVWVSMGQEKVRGQKLKAFKGMQVNAGLMKNAKKDALIMHCLPAHRGEEITDDMIESKNSVVFDQAENRLHMQKAILLKLFKKN